MEFLLLDFIQAHMRCAFLDAVLPVLSRLGNGGLLWIALSVILLLLPRTRRVGAAMALSLALEALCCNVILKPLVARARPFTLRPDVALLIPPPGDFSFPSGHTGSAAAAVTTLYAARQRGRLVFLLTALGIAFSRLYLYVHYPTDVLAGALIGIACGILAWRLTGWVLRRRAGRPERKGE